MPIKPRIDYVKIFDVSPDHISLSDVSYYDSDTVNALVERALMDDRSRAEKAYRKLNNNVENSLGNSFHQRQVKEVVNSVIESVIRINATDPEEYTRVK